MKIPNESVKFTHQALTVITNLHILYILHIFPYFAYFAYLAYSEYFAYFTTFASRLVSNGQFIQTKGRQWVSDFEPRSSKNMQKSNKII